MPEHKKPRKKPERVPLTKQEKANILHRVKVRQERHLNSPVQFEATNFPLDSVLFTYKRSANSSFDDSPDKRRKGGHGRRKKKLARRARWARKPGLNKPPPASVSTPPVPPSAPSPPAPPSGLHPPLLSPPSSPTAVPVSISTTTAVEQSAVSRNLTELPIEIIDEILRYILKWPHEIIVFNDWSRVFPRSRPRLSLSILCTSHMLRNQGLRILFGENQFKYDLRDPSPSHGHTYPVLNQVFGESVVPINEYGHLIRFIKIKVDRTRMHFNEHRRSFERALLKFLPGGDLAHPANLHTLTLEVPALCNDDLDGDPETQQPDEVPICWYLRQGSMVGDALFKIRTQWVRVLACDRYDKYWETEFDLRYFHKDEQLRLDSATSSGDKGCDKAGVTDDQNTSTDPHTVTSYRTKDVEAMEKRWDREVEDAVAGLRNLAWRIEVLAKDPDFVVNQAGMWRPVDSPNVSRRSRTSEKAGLVCLPSNWREASTLSTSRSSRGRAVPARSKRDPSPNSGNTVKPNVKERAKSSTKPKTAAKVSFNDLAIFNAADAVNEARLLEAQKDVREKETEPDRGGMLTVEWLDNLPDNGTEDVGESARGDEREKSISETQTI
ncbi:hypothetical protein F5Y03DRAFT_382820 [Xylaria venustula]|nr:hypothetical protein F5Y03DRAFT_382820 [Xylaria venustula]